MQDSFIKHQKLLDKFLSQTLIYHKDRFSGKGIVICAGGLSYFTNAYVCINILRKHNCNLPIELWHLGKDEMTDRMREIIEPLNVRCVDAYEVSKIYPTRILKGWELKPYAITHSSFKEVLYIDSDNVAVKNPEYLFDSEEYKETGVTFWPDFNNLASNREIWQICRVEYRDEPEFESGQIVIDKEKCWRALNLTIHLNSHSDFYYQYIYGDKETFHMAWRILDQKYSIPKKRIFALPGIMCQHDFSGDRIFQHRNRRKWTLEGQNEMVAGFELNKECIEYVDQLRLLLNKDLPFINRVFIYERCGHDKREIMFLPNGKIGIGSDKMEHTWHFEKDTLIIYDDSSKVTFQVKEDVLGLWHGRWERFEKMPIILRPIEFNLPPKHSDLTILIQGPLNHISIDNISTYSKFGKVIISCWDTDDLSLLKDIKQEILVIKNSYPVGVECNTLNVAKQVHTTLNGLGYVRTEFCIKVRSDESYSDLTKLVDAIKYEEPQKIAVSDFSFVNWPYHPGDHVIAGKTSVLQNGFSGAMDILTNKVNKPMPIYTLPPERIICLGTMKSLGYDVDLDKWADQMREVYILVKTSELGKCIWTNNGRNFSSSDTNINKFMPKKEEFVIESMDQLGVNSYDL